MINDAHFISHFFRNTEWIQNEVRKIRIITTIETTSLLKTWDFQNRKFLLLLLVLLLMMMFCVVLLTLNTQRNNNKKITWIRFRKRVYTECRTMSIEKKLKKIYQNQLMVSSIHLSTEVLPYEHYHLFDVKTKKICTKHLTVYMPQRRKEAIWTGNTFHIEKLEWSNVKRIGWNEEKKNKHKKLLLLEETGKK